VGAEAGVPLPPTGPLTTPISALTVRQLPAPSQVSVMHRQDHRSHDPTQEPGEPAFADRWGSSESVARFCSARSSAVSTLTWPRIRRSSPSATPRSRRRRCAGRAGGFANRGCDLRQRDARTSSSQLATGTSTTAVVTRPGMSGDSVPWEGWSHVGSQYVAEVSAGAEGTRGPDGRRDPWRS
jgi:hypothetical protein